MLLRLFLHDAREFDGLLLIEQLFFLNRLWKGNSLLLPVICPSHLHSANRWEEYSNGSSIDEVTQQAETQGGGGQFEQQLLAMRGQDKGS